MHRKNLNRVQEAQLVEKEIIPKINEKLQLLTYLEGEHEKYNNTVAQKLYERICIISQQTNTDTHGDRDDVETLYKISDNLQNYENERKNFECGTSHMLI